MVLRNGASIVHDDFTAFELAAPKSEHPLAKVLERPESPSDVVALTDAVGSTSAILKSALGLDAEEFVDATDSSKRFFEAPTSGNSATCKSCAQCKVFKALFLYGVEVRYYIP